MRRPRLSFIVVEHRLEVDTHRTSYGKMFLIKRTT